MLLASKRLAGHKSSTMHHPDGDIIKPPIKTIPQSHQHKASSLG